MIGMKQYADQLNQQQNEAMKQQGQGSARIVRENETDDERAARLRQERFERTGVVEAPAYMPEEQYRQSYLGRTWFMTRDVMQQAEECMRICHCWKCETGDIRIEATRFFVRFEDDPMQNYPALAHLTCHRCGHEEYYPLRMDPRKQRDAQAANTYAETQMKQKMAEEKLKALKTHHDELIHRMMADVSKRMGIPPNMLASEAEAMHRILEREAAQQANVAQGLLSRPDQLYGRGIGTANMPAGLDSIARSISDPDARRKFVNQALKEQGKL